MAHRLAHFVASIPLLFDASAWLPGVASAQTVDEKLWSTNGLVNSVVRSGDKIYVGGAFSQVGPSTGGGALIEAGLYFLRLSQSGQVLNARVVLMR